MTRLTECLAAGHEGHACGAASAAKHAHADAASGDESGSEDEDDDATDLVLPGDHRAALTQLLSGSPHKVPARNLLVSMIWSIALRVPAELASRLLKLAA